MRKIKLLFTSPSFDPRETIVLNEDGSLVRFVRSLTIQTPPGRTPSVSLVRVEYGPTGEPDMQFINEECQIAGVEVITQEEYKERFV